MSSGSDPAQAGPRLSAILVARDGWEGIARTLGCLARQECRAAIEVVAVTEARARLSPAPDALRELHGWRTVELPAIESWARAASAGVRAASAPVVALLEDHAFPAPGWAKALLASHAEGYAAVGSAIGNANPRTALGWASLIAAYGPWMAPASEGPVTDVPGHNTGYRRDILLELGPRLESLLEREGGLHAELRARGHRFYLQAAARADHQNVSRPLPALALRFHAGRLAAASRAARGGWPAWRRLAHAAAFPLVPLVRLRAALRDVRRAGRSRELFPRVLPALLLLLGAGGLGEGVGYAFGPGGAARRLNEFEFDRPLRVARGDGDEGAG
jgi:hypothetical protein